MVKYNPDIHHRRSIRLKGYDYTKAGWYFITVCTKNRENLFSNIENGKLILNELGKIARNEWLMTAVIRKNVELDEYLIMPDHIHGIIHIVDEDSKGTASCAPTVPSQTEQFGKPVPNSIPTIIRSYKSAVTRHINISRQTPGVPVWQRNYYEHIIRDEPELNRVRKYIIENPLKWLDNKYNADQF